LEFLAQRGGRQLTRAAAKLAEKALRKVWDGPADAAYDCSVGERRLPGIVSCR
jgi:hypothetical protein